MKMDLEPRVIRNENQYLNYLSIVNQLMDSDPEPESAEGGLLETLVILIEDYERKKGYELPESLTPVEVIKIRMKDLGLKQIDMVPVIGDKSTVSKILHQKRSLTYDMVRKLSQKLKVPADLLIEKTQNVEH